MAYAIKISSLDNTVSWKKNLSEDEYRQCKANAEASRYTIGGIEPLIYPVRSNSLKNFSKDFFFPTLTGLACKVQSCVLSLLGSIVAIAVDIVTLPLRLITVFPRVCLNACRSEQPLRKYLREQGEVDMRLYEAESVQVCLTKTEVREKEKIQTRHEGFVNFIPVPWTPAYAELREITRSSVTGQNGSSVTIVA